MRRSRVSLEFRFDKTRTANVLNCFKNDRSSKWVIAIGDVRSFQKIRWVSRENQS
jgi:hypothetical protein